MARRHRRVGLGQPEAVALEPFPQSADQYPTWYGVPVGVGVTYAATKIMPRFDIKSDWLFPVPYTVPAVALGLLMTRSRRFRRMGYGTLGGALGYYLYAAVWNVGQSAGVRAMARR
jgi:hypothetical protein